MKLKYVSIGLALFLGICVSSAAQAEESGQNAPLPSELKSAPLPPELKKLEETEPPPLPPELQQLKAKQPELPPELQQLMEKKSTPPFLPKEKASPAAEKPAAESAAAAKDKLDDIKAKSNEVP